MRENRIHRIEVHVSCICFDENKVLILRRSSFRRLYPDFWECGGGQVHAGEGFEDAVVRQLREEASVDAEVIGPVGTYMIPMEESEPIPGIYFVCRFIGYAHGSEPVLGDEHTEWKWVSLDELGRYEFIPGLAENIRNAHRLLRFLDKNKQHAGRNV